MKKKIRIAIAVMLIAAAATAAAAIGIRRYLDTPAGTDRAERYVEIPAGAHFMEVAGILEREGIIRGVRRFRWLCGSRGMKPGSRPGSMPCMRP